MKQVIPNPSGKGGFGEHPENRGSGTWDSKMTFSYQYKRFLNMTLEEFKVWDKDTLESESTMVERIAWAAVLKSRSDMKERQEVANRTEGMPRQSTDLTSGGKELQGLVEVNYVKKKD